MIKLITGAVIGSIACLVVACGALERMTATYTGWSRMCVGGVSYLQFTSGASVEYTPEGKIKTCKETQ